jgi:protein AATF/BFR2
MAGFRDATLDKWHRRTVLSSGGVALKGSGLKALQQPISQQVAAMMMEPSKLIRRTQLPVGLAPRPLGNSTVARGVAGEGRGVAGGEDAHGVEGSGEKEQEERDAETYDDGDFYQQLLKELIDAGGAGGMAASGTQTKRRKVVDRRASKGRKIR